VKDLITFELMSGICLVAGRAENSRKNPLSKHQQLIVG